MKRLQWCEHCGEPTGRTTEDSLYIGEIGPLCEICFDEMELPCPRCGEARTRLRPDGCEDYECPSELC